MVGLEAGLFTTVQDAGRRGWRAFGPVAGPMDRYAFALANLLAGNAPGAAALELTLTGPTLRSTVCLHGDTPVAADQAAAIRSRLDREGIAVRAFSAR